MNPLKQWAVLATIVLTVGLASCGGSANQTVAQPRLTSIALSPATTTLAIGGTASLVVTGTYNTGSTTAIAAADVTFQSSNTSVATVSAAGVVTAVANGTATISASDSSASLTTSQGAVITVQAPKLTSISLSPLASTVAPGGTQQLSVVGTYDTGTTASLPASGETFASSNTSVATVDPAGLVTVASSATAGQTATITATDSASGLTTSAQDSTVITVGQASSVATNVLSTGFNSNGTTTTSTSSSGKWFAYSGGANNPAGGSGGGYADQGASPSYEYVYLQDTAANLAGYTYQGVGIQAATGQTVSASGYDSLGFTLAVNQEWFSQGANFVVLIAANVNGTSSATCNPQVAAVVTATASAATAYTVPLTAFTKITQNCGNTNVTIAQILASPITQIDFQADGGTAAITASGLTSTTNTTVALAGSNPATYPTTVNVVGTVEFVNASTPPPPPTTTTNVLSTGFNSNGTTTTSTSSGGKWSVYSGGANNPAGGSGGGYADQGASPSYEYVYLQDTAANLAGYTYQGVGIQAATGQTVSASGYNSLGFTLAVNQEWFSQGANFVVLIAANVSGTSSATCNPQVAAVVTATASAATAYTVPLTAFTKITQNCGNTNVTIAQILASPITQIDFQADGGTAAITASGLTSTTNTTVALAGSNPATYPTTVNVVGTVDFVNASAPPPPTTTTNVLSTGFNSNATTTTSTATDGKWFEYFGGANNPAGGSGGGYADQGASPSYEYVYVQDTAANLAGYTYQGVGIQPATGQTVSASGYNNLSFTLAVNPEWYSSGANFVVLIAANVSGTSSATCNPQVAAVVAATASAATPYLVPLTAFTKITQNCGNSSVTIAQILASPITEIDFQADGGTAAITASGLTSNTNTSVAASGSSPTTYPTTVNVVGGVQFAP